VTTKKPKTKPVMLADVKFTDTTERECERYVARVRRSGLPRRRGWRLYQPYDKQNKCFLAEPIGDDQLPGSWNAGEIYDWLAETPVDWYENRTGAKGQVRWERILERRKLKAVEQKLDKIA
jgi:hypothetical protein